MLLDRKMVPASKMNSLLRSAARSSNAAAFHSLKPQRHHAAPSFQYTRMFSSSAAAMPVSHGALQASNEKEAAQAAIAEAAEMWSLPESGDGSNFSGIEDQSSLPRLTPQDFSFKQFEEITMQQIGETNPEAPQAETGAESASSAKDANHSTSLFTSPSVEFLRISDSLSENKSRNDPARSPSPDSPLHLSDAVQAQAILLAHRLEHRLPTFCDATGSGAIGNGVRTFIQANSCLRTRVEAFGIDKNISESSEAGSFLLQRERVADFFLAKIDRRKSLRLSAKDVETIREEMRIEELQNLQTGMELVGVVDSDSTSKNLLNSGHRPKEAASEDQSEDHILARLEERMTNQTPEELRFRLEHTSLSRFIFRKPPLLQSIGFIPHYHRHEGSEDIGIRFEPLLIKHTEGGMPSLYYDNTGKSQPGDGSKFTTYPPKKREKLGEEADRLQARWERFCDFKNCGGEIKTRQKVIAKERYDWQIANGVKMMAIASQNGNSSGTKEFCAVASYQLSRDTRSGDPKFRGQKMTEIRFDLFPA